MKNSHLGPTGIATGPVALLSAALATDRPQLMKVFGGQVMKAVEWEKSNMLMTGEMASCVEAMVQALIGMSSALEHLRSKERRKDFEIEEARKILQDAAQRYSEFQEEFDD